MPPAVLLVGLLALLPCTPPARSDVVVLNNGSLFEGAVLRTGEQLTVWLASGGRLMLPVEQVAYVGPDAASAFDHQARRLAVEDLPGRVRLFHWALRYGLQPQATALLAQLRAAYPHRTDLAALEKRLHQPTAPSVQIPARRPQAGSSGAEGPAVEVPVSDETLRAFADRVQPLLVNGCAAAGCHGRLGESAFRLRSAGTRSREPRHLTVANMRSVLAYIQPEDPPTSPLIAYALRPHGTQRRMPLSDRDQRGAYPVLLEWIEMASRDLAGAQARSGSDPAAPEEALPAAGGLRELDPRQFNEQFLEGGGNPGAPAGPEEDQQPSEAGPVPPQSLPG